MTSTSMERRGGGSSYVQRSSSSGLYDVLDLILDKGLVIDIFVRVSLVGIEILTIDARIVIASVDTYLRFAEAVDRLDLEDKGGQKLPELVSDMAEDGGSSKTKGAIEGAKESLFGSDDDESEERERQPAQRRSSASQGQAKRRVSSRGGDGPSRRSNKK
jgi:gas vesicle structural protein